MRLDIEQVIDGAPLGPLRWRVLGLYALVTLGIQTGPLFWLAIVPPLICAGGVALLRPRVMVRYA